MLSLFKIQIFENKVVGNYLEVIMFKPCWKLLVNFLEIATNVG